MEKPLIICIGNVARGDDGVAHQTCERLRRWGVEADLVTAVGLDVAMAADVAEASLLVIVDAQRRHTPLVAVRELEAGPASGATGHGIDPPALLALATSLYGGAPRAWIVSVAAPEMGHGEVLSETARAASEEAALAVRDLLSLAGDG